MAELSIVLENLELFIRVLVDQVDVEAANPEEGKQFTTLALYHRARGVAQYLLTADSEAAAASLARSVQARRTHLERVEAGVAKDHPDFRTTVHNRAFFDAVVLGDTASSDVLALACHSRWNPDREYEDDFLFASFWHRFYLQLRSITLPDEPQHPAQPTGLPELIARLEVVQDDSGTPEGELCQAALARDGETFDRAIVAMIDARAEQFQENLTLPPELTATERHVFVNGLGIVLLARMAEVPTAREYPTIPAGLLALGPRSAAPPDSWRTLG